ncbi:MAG: spore coat protein U domain-containing protein, partial [Myxococcales bacterium]|nr:spore coat protein U domain-containing protein [Myxococcales bacterium]
CVFDSIVDSGFGNISGLFTADADISSGSISVQCTNLAGYSIGIDNGSNFLVNRRMAFSGNFINYELYQDSGYTQVWGDISSGNEKLLQVGDGAVQAHTVYARIPSGQSPAGAGSYSDQVTVTVNF